MIGLQNPIAPPEVGGNVLADASRAFPAGVPDSTAEGNYGRREVIEKFFKDRHKDAFHNRWVFERLWWRNLLYYAGRQWIYYTSARGWADKRLAKWVPRPVTNKIRETANAMMSVFQAVQLGLVITPNGQDPRNISAAETADKMEPLIREEHEMEQVMALHDFWLIMTGSAVLHTWWNKNADTGNIIQAFEQCDACQKVFPPEALANNICPACGSFQFSKALDPETQQPIGRELSSGRGQTDVLSPFEWAVPPAITKWPELPYGIRLRWRDWDWVEIHHPEIAEKIHKSTMPDERSLQLLKAVASLSDVHNSPFAWGGGGDSNESDGAEEYEIWAKPCEEFPDGLVARFMGSQFELVEDSSQGLPGPMPYETATGDKLFPFCHTVYEQVGGRFWGQSPIDAAIQIQDQINQIDSLVQMIIQRVANPIWLEPKGAEVKSFTGEPGMVVRYNPLAGGGGGLAKPERLAGENVPSSLVQIREQKILDIEAITGTSDVLKGMKPAGVEAFSAMQLLVERSQTRFTPVLKNRGKCYRDWYSLAIEIERQFGPKERTFSVLGPNKGYTYENFKNIELQGAIMVRIEDGSQVPKTSLGTRAAIEQLNQLGFIRPGDPDHEFMIYRKFGLLDMIPRLDSAVTSALSEQQAFEDWSATADEMLIQQAMMAQQQAAMAAAEAGMPPPPPGPMSPLQMKPWHEDTVHIPEHTKWLNGDRMRQILTEKPFLEAVVTQHYMEHQQRFAMAQMQQAQAQAQAKGGAGGAQAMDRSNSESGGADNVPGGSRETPQKQGPA